MNTRLDRMFTTFAVATPEQRSVIGRLLVEAGLPADDLEAANPADFELARDDAGEVVGVAGLEVWGPSALLRSLVVVPSARAQGLGRMLVARREAAAQAAGVNTIYLLTTSADGLFRRLGYRDIPREAVPPAIANHPQFRSLCPASAKCLAKSLP